MNILGFTQSELDDNWVRKVLLASLSLGFLWAWFLSAGNVGMKVLGVEVPYTLPFHVASLSSAILVMFLYPLLRTKALSDKRCIVGALCSCIICTALILIWQAFEYEHMAILTACGFFAGLSYSLLLAVWISKNISTDFLSLFICATLASVVMIILYFFLSLSPEGLTPWCALVLMSATAILMNVSPTVSAEDRVDSSASASQPKRTIFFFVSLILSGGIVNGLLMYTWVAVDDLNWAYAVVPMGIVICAFIVVLRKQLTPSISFALLSGMVCVSLLIALFLPAGVTLLSSVIYAGAWFLFAFTIVASVWCGSFHGEKAVKIACFYVACIITAVALSNCITYLLPGQDSTFLVIAAVLLAFSLSLSAIAGIDSISAVTNDNEGASLNKDAQCRILAGQKGLTEREFDVLCLLAKGYSLKAIAENLVLSENTVKSHRRRIYLKIGINSRQSLISCIEEISE